MWDVQPSDQRCQCLWVKTPSLCILSPQLEVLRYLLQLLSICTCSRENHRCMISSDATWHLGAFKLLCSLYTVSFGEAGLGGKGKVCEQFPVIKRRRYNPPGVAVSSSAVSCTSNHAYFLYLMAADIYLLLNIAGGGIVLYFVLTNLWFNSVSIPSRFKLCLRCRGISTGETRES